MRWLAKSWWGLVRLGFRLLYNQLAFTYDTVSNVVSLGAWRCWQRAAIKHLRAEPGALILELAHGTGDLQVDLQAIGYRTIGFDLSPYMGRIAQSKLHQSGLLARLVRGRAQELPFPTGQFKSVVVTFPTSFIVEDESLREIHRILEDDGTLVIVPNAIFVVRGIMPGFLEALYRVTGQRGGDTHVLQRQAEAIFGSHGFAVQFFKETCPRSVVQIISARKQHL
jgi:ubiquinone/menaquinone biosynthesis C-methylase UbiE